MARDFFIHGENMVSVKGMTNSTIASLTELGLSEQAVKVSLDFKNRDITLNAWGDQSVPADVQHMLAMATVTLSLIHYDTAVLDECIRLSMGGPAAVGLVSSAGRRLGNNLARFAAGNRFISVNIASTVGAKPYRFYYCHLINTADFPSGTERQVVAVTFRAIPYTTDPWGGGLGALGSVLWDHTLDT
jgi:hypothetical protein